MMAFHNDEVERLRNLFEKFEREEILEEKAKYYNAAMSEAKVALKDNEDSQCERVITNLMTTYLRKFLEYIATTGKKSPIDIFILLILSNSEPAQLVKLKNEYPDLAEKYDVFFTLAANNKWVMNRLILQLKG
jgi:hypothetical protein